jgi:glycerol uptake facilitator-like aquaporin
LGHYGIAQLAGALVASFLLRALFGDLADLGTARPAFGVARAFVFELLLTLFRVVVTLGTATRHRVLGADAAIASGGVVALCGLFARPVSGAVANPARALAPAVVSGAMANQWLYLAAPFAGAVLATAVMAIVHHRRHAEERQAAGGEPKE